MTEVISVRFKSKGKVYYFSPNGFSIAPGSYVIVETSKGLEYAECVRGNHEVEDSLVVPPLRPVIRPATDEDAAIAAENKKKEAEAFEICKQKINAHALDMKLVDVEYNFEGNKILFFFTSDGRVDFRDLVKDLAAIFKTRIELRQIGVRDEARMLGGLGICGKPFCCAQFFDDFQPVSIKMAKTQGLSLNPTKISGTCGRLMCCLKYEQDTYEDLVKDVPKLDSFVETPDGKGAVVDVNLLRGKVRVRLDDTNETIMKTYDASDVSVLGGKAARAEYLANRTEEIAAAEARRAEAKAAAEAKRAEAKAAAMAAAAERAAKAAERRAVEEQAKQEKQPKQEKTEAPEQKRAGDNRRRHRHRSGNYVEHRNNETGSNQQMQPEKLQHQEKTAKHPKPENAAPETKSADGTVKKNNNHHRRHRPHSKPVGEGRRHSENSKTDEK